MLLEKTNESATVNNGGEVHILLGAAQSRQDELLNQSTVVTQPAARSAAVQDPASTRDLHVHVRKQIT